MAQNVEYLQRIERCRGQKEELLPAHTSVEDGKVCKVTLVEHANCTCGEYCHKILRFCDGTTEFAPITRLIMAPKTA
jgi:hypothetical protein